MLLGEYRFHATFADEAILPPCKGSTFRGVFGRALKEVACALKRQECPACLLRHQCVYTQVFETPRDFAKGPSPPHPFVIEPPLTTQTLLSKGDNFDFTLLLFGGVNQFLPYFVYAFEQMGEIGIGRKVNGQRAQFSLLSVTSNAGEIYRAEDRCLLPSGAVDLALEPPPSANRQITKVNLALITPLRFKYQNHLQADLSFHVLIRAILRRISVLHTFFGDGEPPLDYKGLVARAHAVSTARSSLRWCDWRRYSFRQGQSMLMGGMVGEVTYQGNLGEFLPLLRFAEKVHVGKATTFGLGKIRVVA